MAEYRADSLERFRLNCNLPPRFPWADRIHYFDTVSSTNTLAKEMAEQGAPHGTLVLADGQTAGRGRMGRSFHSPAGKGIYFSLILRPGCAPAELMHLTCAVAVTVRDSIRHHLGSEHSHEDPRIKWTNDLVVGTKKIGGILTEMSVDPKSGLVRYAVIGIGINYSYNTTDFPPELRDMAGSVAMFYGDSRSRLDLLCRMLYDLERMDQILLTEKAALMARYRESCMTIGQEVSLHRFEEVRHGTAVGVDDDGALLVRFSDGHTEAISAGEVSIRGMYGYV